MKDSVVGVVVINENNSQTILVRVEGQPYSFHGTITDMSDNKQLGKLREKLLYGFETEGQLETVKELWSMGSVEALEVMADAILSPQIVVRGEILEFISFAKHPEIFDYLTEVLAGCSEAALWKIQQSFEEKNLRSRFLSKLDGLHDDLTGYPLMAAILRFLGYIADPEIMETIAQLIYTDDDGVQMAVIDSLEYSQPDKCPRNLFAALKMFGPEVAQRALVLMGKLKDRNTVVPMVYLLGEVGGLMAEQIVAILKSFDRKELAKTIVTYVGDDKANLDMELLHSWIVFLERTGDLEGARKFREHFGIEREVHREANSEATSGTSLTFELKEAGEFAILKLKGILDLYTLSRMEKVLKLMIRNGHARILLLCGELSRLDRHAAAYLRRMDTNLRKMFGGFKYVRLECLNFTEKKLLLPNSEFFRDASSAFASFLEEPQQQVVKLEESLMSSCGRSVDVRFSSKDVEKTRVAEILSREQNYLVLSWPVFDETDRFKEFENDDITLIITVGARLLEAKTRVCEQDEDLPPSIKVLLPRTARTIGRISHARVDCRLTVTVRKITGSQQVDKSSFPAMCTRISEQDLFLMTAVPLKEDAQVVITPDQSKIRMGSIIGRVTRRVELPMANKRFYEYTLGFISISGRDLAVLKKYVYSLISAKS